MVAACAKKEAKPTGLAVTPASPNTPEERRYPLTGEIVSDARAELEVQRAEAAAKLSFVGEACMTELNQSLDELGRATLRRRDVSATARDSKTGPARQALSAPSLWRSHRLTAIRCCW